jgi:hypothetical protein
MGRDLRRQYRARPWWFRLFHRVMHALALHDRYAWTETTTRCITCGRVEGV